MIGEYDSNNSPIREYIYLGNQQIALFSSEKENEVLQIHTDHLGTPRAVTNSNSETLWKWEGDAFGSQSPQVEQVKLPLRMAGQYADDESGLFYNYFRYYNPATGRYLRSDPLGLEGGLNTFGYVGGSPLLQTDSTGLLRDEVRNCVCDAMRASNYQATMAWSNVLGARKAIEWNHRELRPCENYLYAYVSVKDYGDNPFIVFFDVEGHAFSKKIAKYIPVISTSPSSSEAQRAGHEGWIDAVNNKDWRTECEYGQC